VPEILVMSALILMGTRSASPEEPTYKDRSARQWLIDLQSGVEPGAKAVRELGQDAVAIAPTLIQGFATVSTQIRVTSCIAPNNSAGVRIAAASGWMGRAVKPLLVAALESQDSQICGWAGFTLLFVRWKDQPLPRQISTLLGERDSQVRYLVASGLWLGAKRPEAVPYLIDALRDNDSQTRSRIMQALQRLDAAAAKEHAIP
jgi:HEAT repeats